MDAIPLRAWPSLTRHFHPSDPRLFLDSKIGSCPVIYVSSPEELWRFAHWQESHPHLSIKVLPAFKSVADFARLTPGLLALLPDSKFVVPGGRFNEMYGWDSFFIAKGLLHSPTPPGAATASGHHLDLALDQLRNLSYQVLSFGKIHNATRSYFVNRSNPPFLSSLVKAVLHAAGDAANCRAARVHEAVELGVRAASHELLFYWLTPEKTCPKTGLVFWGSRSQASLCLAVEAGHYDEVFGRLAEARGVAVEELVKEVSSGRWSEEDTEVWKLVEHDLAVRESGHDTTERLVDSASDLVTADLNSLLLKTAKDLYELTGNELFKDIAGKLEDAMMKWLYDEELGYLCDYDVVAGVKKRFLSPAGVVYPLWAGMGDEEVRKRLRDTLVIYLEARGGVVGSEKLNWSCGSISQEGRQWDWPFGWAPHQMLAWEGLAQAGFQEDARRIAFRWLATLTKVYAQHGCVPEKIDVVTKGDPMGAGAKVEYGTQCAGQDEFFGWTAASVVVGAQYLGEHERVALTEITAETCVEEQLAFLRNLGKRRVDVDVNDVTWSTVASE